MWFRSLMIGLAFLSVSVLSAGLVSANPSPKAAENFTVKSLSGRNIKLSEQRGRVVLLNFWATWCAPCKEELPYFNALYGKYKNLGLEVLGVNIDKTRGEAERMSTALKLDFPILLDPTGHIGNLYLIRSMPTTYLIAKDGTVRHVHWGFGPDEPKRYEEEIRALLKE